MTESIEQLIEALAEAASSFKSAESEVPDFLYVSRCDGEWDIVFTFSDGAPCCYSASMVEFLTDEYAEEAFMQVVSGRGIEIADEIIKGWNTDWDTES